MKPSPAVSVIVFDLDHTIVHCDSFAGFTRSLLLRAWWRAALAILASPLIVALALAARTRLFAVSALVWLATVGLDEEMLHSLMDEHVAERFGGQSPLGCQQAIAALREHQLAGARVLIATGALASLAQRVCREVGIQEVEIVGSSLRPWLGGWVADQHCYGRRKLEMLLAHGAGERWDCVYTDSAADLPILAFGSRRLVVNPTRADRKKIAAMLGTEFEIMEWRRGR
jgi:phosphatidylglycerophosphatase C